MKHCQSHQHHKMTKEGSVLNGSVGNVPLVPKNTPKFDINHFQTKSIKTLLFRYMVTSRAPPGTTQLPYVPNITTAVTIFTYSVPDVSVILDEV